MSNEAIVGSVPMEIELKLRIDAESIRTLRKHPLVAEFVRSKPQARQLISIYFDTPDLYLRRHDSALRVRRIQRTWMQTFKSGGASLAGLHARNEWESRVRQAHPDLQDIAARVGEGDGIAAILQRPGLSADLVPIFETRFRRTTWQLQLPVGDKFELALDVGEIRDGVHRVPLSEIELELKGGDPAVLFEFALALLDDIPLRIETRSKAGRGYAFGLPPSSSVKATQPDVRKSMTVGEAMTEVLGHCLAQVQDNEHGVDESGDAEAIHQMRVGLRRLRFALRVFQRVASCPDEVREELRWLAMTLGAARDWEVLVDSTLTSVIDANPDESALPRLRTAALGRLLGLRKTAIAAVRSTRYTRLVLNLGRWMLEIAPPAALDGPLAARLPEFAAQSLASWRKRTVRASLSALSGGDEARHQWRIAIKKLRYATEFFAPLNPAKRTQPVIALLGALQDELGQHNDRAVASSMIRELVASDTELAGAARFADGYLAAQCHARRICAGRLWKKILRL